jgi:micrococcal nuclease
LPKSPLPCALALIISATGCAQDRALAQYLSPNHLKQDCQLEAGGESTVVAVDGPQTLRLADGRFLRLAEILVPTPVPAGFDPSAAAVAYLRQAALGRKVEVKFAGTQRDRYGVYIGYVYVVGEPVVWLQEGLVRAGFATVFPQASNHSCAPQLLAVEAAARQEKSGHWGLGYFKVLKVNDPRLILNSAGTWQIVEGTTNSASQNGERVALHFSATQKYGFTATIDPAVRKRFADKQAPEGWAKLTLRVRGWIEKKRGATISVTVPEQIEFLPPTQPPPAHAIDTVR